MISSMTGFGDAVLEDQSRHYHLEIRTVNNRYFKAGIRLPDDLAFLEPEVERYLKVHITRGSVSFGLYVLDIGEAAAQQINAAAVQRYIEQLRAVAGTDPRVTIDAAAMLELPGVIVPREMTEQERQRAWQTVSKLLLQALERLLVMRREEGKALAADLARHCDLIQEQLAAVRARAPLVVDEFRKRLHSRVQELIHESGVKLAEEHLVREVGVYAERSDVAEEIARLSSHLEQFRECFTMREPAGRKMDFIAQEMLREANTIGSKASDAAIARHIIEIKGAIDRIKEQVQNVE